MKKISEYEARENLNHYNLYELQQEAERFEISPEEKDKSQLINELLKAYAVTYLINFRRLTV